MKGLFTIEVIGDTVANPEFSLSAIELYFVPYFCGLCIDKGIKVWYTCHSVTTMGVHCTVGMYLLYLNI